MIYTYKRAVKNIHDQEAENYLCIKIFEKIISLNFCLMETSK